MNADAGRRRTELAMFQPPLSAPAGAGDDVPRAVVLPAPDAAGLLPTLDGRQHRVPDPARLAEAINGQPIEVRVDTDHQSEPISPTFQGSTHACGWLRDFRASATGEISAAFHLTAVGEALLRSHAYRYLSPAVMLDQDEVTGLTSVALVNNPNLSLEAPVMNRQETNTQPNKQQSSPAGDSAGGAADREAALEQREAALEQRELHAAEAAVDRAVENKWILPAQKEFLLHSVRCHPQGVAAGLAAFESAFGGGQAAAAPADLDQRIGPTGPPQKAPTAPAIVAPDGYRVSDAPERLQMHARITEHARRQGISYRAALVALHAAV